MLVQRPPPPLAPNKHVAGDSLGRARESRCPAPSRSPSSAPAAGSWEPGGCTGIWRSKTSSRARLGELGSREAEAWAWGLRCALCCLWERALAVPARRSRQ